LFALVVNQMQTLIHVIEQSQPWELKLMPSQADLNQVGFISLRPGRILLAQWLQEYVSWDRIIALACPIALSNSLVC